MTERVEVAICSGALFNSEQEQLVALSAAARLPVVSSYTASVAAGVLAAYGADLTTNHQRAADYVDRILKGAKPIDLPIEALNPILAINLKTARSLGLTIPSTVVFRADRLIE